MSDVGGPHESEREAVLRRLAAHYRMRATVEHYGQDLLVMAERAEAYAAELTKVIDP